MANPYPPPWLQLKFTGNRAQVSIPALIDEAYNEGEEDVFGPGGRPGSVTNIPATVNFGEEAATFDVLPVALQAVPGTFLGAFRLVFEGDTTSFALVQNSGDIYHQCDEGDYCWA